MCLTPEAPSDEAMLSTRRIREMVRRSPASVVMGLRPPPARHWRSYGDDKLPTPADALAEPFRAFPSWFMRIEAPQRTGVARDALTIG
jgi:hypothetical protein